MSAIKNVPSLVSGNTAENDCQLELINKAVCHIVFTLVLPKIGKLKFSLYIYHLFLIRQEVKIYSQISSGAFLFITQRLILQDISWL